MLLVGITLYGFQGGSTLSQTWSANALVLHSTLLCALCACSESSSSTAAPSAQHTAVLNNTTSATAGTTAAAAVPLSPAAMRKLWRRLGRCAANGRTTAHSNGALLQGARENGPYGASQLKRVLKDVFGFTASSGEASALCRALNNDRYFNIQQISLVAGL
jgi:hypothetical protein